MYYHGLEDRKYDYGKYTMSKTIGQLKNPLEVRKEKSDIDGTGSEYRKSPKKWVKLMSEAAFALITQIGALTQKV
jgi:hypothetical protein